MTNPCHTKKAKTRCILHKNKKMRISILSSPTEHCFEVLVREIKGIRIESKGSQIIFIDDIILYLQYLKDFTKRLLSLKTSKKISEYKINTNT